MFPKGLFPSVVKTGTMRLGFKDLCPLTCRVFDGSRTYDGNLLELLLGQDDFAVKQEGTCTLSKIN